MKPCLCLWLLLSYSTLLLCQEEQSYWLKGSPVPIVVDGVLSEVEWAGVPAVSNFQLNFPASDSLVLGQSEVRLRFDNEYLYIAARLYTPPGFDGYRVQSLQRDFDLLANEAFMVVIDSYADHTNGYYFEVTPFGNKGELLAANSGRFDGVNDAWDSRWYAASQRTDESWTTEMAIPLRSLRYRPDQTHWRVNFVRIDKSSNQYSSWARVPRNFDVWDLNFTGKLVFPQALPTTRRSPNILPGLTVRLEEDRQTDSEEAELIPSLDAKFNIGQSLNLDLTINPDFSQTDVDEQQVNIGRFELFFPERRQFFLENEDLFSSYGFIPVRPFFSRRIGLTFDSGTGNYRNVPLSGGLRLSGKIGTRSRLGFMSVQASGISDFTSDEATGLSFDLPAINYSVLAYQQQLFQRSNLKVMLVNKQATSKTDAPFTDFNRNLSLQYNFARADGRFYGWLFGSKTSTAGSGGDGFAYGTSMVYNHPHWRVLFSGRSIDEEYNAEVGFVRRRGVSEFFINPAWRYYPKKWFGENRVGIRASLFQDESFRNVDRAIGLYHQSFLKNGHSLLLQYSWKHTVLQAAFDPSRSGGMALDTGIGFDYQDFQMEFSSNQRARFWYDAEGTVGQYFNGHRYQFSTRLNWRFQPYLNLSLRFRHTQVVLPSPFSSSVFNVITPAVKATISRNLFINLLAQYNQQSDNVNINFRLQWRFRPLSDLFLVYSSNHLPEGLGMKQRALTLKMIYLL